MGELDGLTFTTLVLVAGRYALMIGAALLALERTVWFARGGHDVPWRTRRQTVRAAIELVVGTTLAGVYAQQLYFEGFVVRFTDPESAILVWSVAILLIGITINRAEGRTHHAR